MKTFSKDVLGSTTAFYHLIGLFGILLMKCKPAADEMLDMTANLLHLIITIIHGIDETNKSQSYNNETNPLNTSMGEIHMYQIYLFV